MLLLLLLLASWLRRLLGHLHLARHLGLDLLWLLQLGLWLLLRLGLVLLWLLLGLHRRRDLLGSGQLVHRVLQRRHLQVRLALLRHLCLGLGFSTLVTVTLAGCGVVW